MTEATQDELAEGGFRRSKDRCHLISCVPVIDISGQCNLYSLGFTSGRLFMPDALRERHIHHVLTGYMIRRDVSLFVGSGNSAMLRLPLANSLLEYLDRIPAGRLVIYLQKGEEPTVSSQHLLRTLNHLNVRFAIDIDELLTTAWRYCTNCISYVVLNIQDEHFEENIVLFRQYVASAPWLRLIVRGFENGMDIARAGKAGTDLCMSNLIYPELGAILKEESQNSPHLLVMVQALLKSRPDIEMLTALTGSHPGMVRDFYTGVRYICSRSGVAASISSVEEAVQHLGAGVVASTFAVCVVRHICDRCERVTPEGTHVNYARVLLRASLVRAFFLFYMSRHAGRNPKTQSLSFVTGLFSLLREQSRLNGIPVAEDERLYGGHSEESAWNLQLLTAMEGFELPRLTLVAEASFDTGQPLGGLLKCYEKALMRGDDVYALLLRQREYHAATVV